MPVLDSIQQKMTILEEMNCGIDKDHLEEWRNSGVSDRIILANVTTLHDQLQVDRILNRRSKKMWNRPEDLIPCWCVKGIDPLSGMNTYQGVQVKPAKPRINDKGKPIKYEGARDSDTAPLFLDVGYEGYWQSILENVNEKIIITEGAKKAGALLSHDFCGISIPGVTTCRKRGRLHQNLELFAKVGRSIYLCFDNDILTKKEVRNALKGMGAILKSHGAVVFVVLLPPGDLKGADDFLSKNGKEAFQVLLDESLSIQEWVDQIAEMDEEEEDKIPQSRLARHFSLIKEEWGDKLRLNQLTKEVELAGVELNEDEVRLTMALDFDIDISNSDAHSIINRLARADEYSPIVEYLDEIAGKYSEIDPSFLDGLSLKYFGSSEPMHAIYLKKFLIGAVARARNPGCKLDTVLMLVGAQGCGKSSFLENLFGRRFFTDQIGGELNDKDEKAKVSRYWCLEYAEFEAVYKKKDVSSLKRFITAKEDTFRAPYARKEARHPRPSLFAGTTNETEILLDPTGDRRFWVLKVEADKIPLAELIKDRDMIWAAADSLYKRGHRWDLTDQEEKSRVDLNRHFRKTHYWDDLIEQLWIESQPASFLTVEGIAKKLGFESASSVKGGDLHVIKESLERLGFSKVTKRVNGVLSRSCWERKISMKEGASDVTDVTPVTSLTASGFEAVTSPVTPPVTDVINEVIQMEIVAPVTPPVTAPVTPSNPVAPRVAAFVTAVTSAISENQKSEIEIYIPPEINADLLRVCITEQNWQMVAALTEEWDAGYKSEVWACLSESEKQSLKMLKAIPESADYDQFKTPLLMEGRTYFSVKEKSKIKIFVISPDGKSVQAQVEGRKGIYQIPSSDIRCCDESPYSHLAVGDKVKILSSGKRGIISSMIDADIYLKDDRNKSIKGIYMAHHLQRIEI